MGCVYLITNTVNGKQYVGQTTTSFEERWKRHLADTRRCLDTSPVLHRAIRRYGEGAFAHEILHEGIDDREELNRLEIEEIALRVTIAPKGYNMTSGGSFGPLCEEAVEKIRQSWADPEIREKRVFGIKRAFADPEVKERKRLSIIAFQDDEYREKQRQITLRRYEDPAEREAQAEKTRQSWNDPEIRARRMAGQEVFRNDPEQWEAAKQARSVAVRQTKRRLAKNVFADGRAFDCIPSAAEGLAMTYTQVWDRVTSKREKWRFWHYIPNHNDPETDAVEECWAQMQFAAACPEHPNVPEWARAQPDLELVALEQEIADMIAARRRNRESEAA